MAFSPTQNSCDLSFDAVPDKPRETIIESNVDNEKASLPSSNSVPSVPAAETIKSNLETEIPTDSVSVNTNNVIVPSKPKRSGERRKTSHKTTENSPQQGVRVFNIIKSTGVHVGNNVVIQCGPTNPNPGVKTRKISKEVEKLLSSTEVVTLTHIASVSSLVGANWKDVGRRLRYKDPQLEQIEEDNRIKGLKEVVYQLLLDWKRVNTSRATIGLLCKALWKAEQYDAVDEVLSMTNGEHSTKSCS